MERLRRGSYAPLPMDTVLAGAGGGATNDVLRMPEKGYRDTSLRHRSLSLLTQLTLSASEIQGGRMMTEQKVAVYVSTSTPHKQ